MTAPHRVSIRAATVLTVVAIAAACGEDPPPPKELIVIDGITIELAEVDPFVQFLDSYVPEAGRKAKVQRILEEHLLPLHLARRAFGERRREQLERAKNLCAVASNVDELERQTVAVQEKVRAFVSRSQPKLPIAEFLFDPLLARSVSPPLELPYGWVVAACYGVEEGALAIDDRADTLQITFGTHSAVEWQVWLDKEQKRIADKVTFVHPDYREAMPPWIILPKLP